MKVYASDKLRNVALVGHQSSGKTMLIESILYNSGAINRMGSISEGNTVSDWEDEEKSRGLSLSTSLIQFEFEDHKINLLDAPGYTDFQGEVKNAIRATDATIVVVDAVSGVEVGTELAWEYAQTYQQPIIVVINKMDRENADFEGTLEDLRETFEDYKFVPVMIPIGKESDFKGVAGVLTGKAYYGVGNERSEPPAEMADEIEAAHTALVEAAAEADDDYIEKYFETGELSFEEVRDGMRKASRSSDLKTVPVFVTSGLQNVGVYPLMEALIAYVGDPTQRRVGVIREDDGEMDFLTAPQSDDAPLAAYVFKTVNDKYVGTLNFFRIFSGTITVDSRNYNANSGEIERFNNIFNMCGKAQNNVKQLHVGDIGVVAKLTHTKTGDTFVDKDQTFSILLPDFPPPLYMVAVSPKTQAESAKMGGILTSLTQADPTLRWRMDADTRETVLEGMGEIHINVAVKRAEALGVGLNMRMPRVPYRETVTKEQEATYRHKKQSGGAGQFGEVSLRVMPHEGEFTYETNIFGGAISHQFLPSIEKGIRQVLEEGIIAGYPVVNVKAVAFDGKEHPVDSKDIAFQIAGREAFKEAFKAANPALLEPIMDVSITIPETMMGDIMGDLNTRRGRVHGMDSIGRKSIVNAHVPLAEMLRYGNDLRSMTGGRGIYTMEFLKYDAVPGHLQNDVIAASQNGS
ncbi:MAG: elongation factor G [Aggregatilineales bacterium]